MSTFRAVNTTITATDPPPKAGGDATPTTPRPTKFFSEQHAEDDVRSEDPSAKTPTRDSFGGVAGQRPLPTTPLSSSHSRSDSKLRGSVSRERPSSSAESPKDVKMSDGKDAQASDDEGAHSDTNRPSKKKKGQRFFCTEYPPCQLSFTRSEHLARHIRKHTGERPFQCHCNRRFSRLDNLRQHAQTVHQNEDIPIDSLAATGTRFQRQIRTDRVRPATNRARSATFGSQPPSAVAAAAAAHARGHSRNLSASSITSVSTTSSLGDDLRRRPTPLTSDHTRGRLSLESFPVTSGGTHQPFYTVGNHSPTGYSTPTSATFSIGTNSPRFSSGFVTPASSSASRPLAYGSKSSTSRRLSVPSTNAFQAPHPSSSALYPPPYVSPVPSASGPTFSNASSHFASPTSSIFSSDLRHESLSAAEELRRRTWHPSTQTGLGGSRPSALSHVQTPPDHHLPLHGPRPVFPSQQQQQPSPPLPRLPGIESFDQAPPPASLVRRGSPMQLDPPVPPLPHSKPQLQRTEHQALPGTEDSHSLSRHSRDFSLHKGITKLEIVNRGPSNGSSGGSGGSGSARDAMAWSPLQQPAAFPGPQPTSVPTTRFSDQPLPTSRRNKRLAWYNGPLQLGSSSGTPAPNSTSTTGGVNLRASPEDSSSSDGGVPTPSSGSVVEYAPKIVGSNGYGEVHANGYAVEDHGKMHPTSPPQHHQQRPPPPQHAQHPYGDEFRNGSAVHLPSIKPPALAQAQAPTQPQQAPSQPAFQNPQFTPHALQKEGAPEQTPPDMRRLEALVAVATRDGGGMG